MSDQSFGKQYRLRRRSEFDRVFASKAFAADDHLVVHGAPNGLEYSRLGLSVSRKVGTAVVRNRWKRIIREAFRRGRHELPAGLDLVVRPRRGAVPDGRAVRRSLSRLARRVARRLEKQNR